MRKSVKIAVFVGIILLILGMIFYPKIKSSFVSSGKQPSLAPAMGSPRSQSLSVNAIVLKPQSMNDVFRTKGVLLPDEEVDLIFETSGKITQIGSVLCWPKML